MRIAAAAVKFIIILFTCLNQAHANKETFKFKNWNVHESERFVRYVTHGRAVHGHQLGLIKMAGNCSEDLFWISWSTYEDGAEKFEGGKAGFIFLIGEERYDVDVPLLSTYKATALLTIVSFSNQIAADAIKSALKKGLKAEVMIASPNDLVQLFDINTDYFNLHGFTAAQSKAQELCEGLG